MGSVGMYNHDPLACSGPDTTIRRPKLDHLRGHTVIDQGISFGSYPPAAVSWTGRWAAASRWGR